MGFNQNKGSDLKWLAEQVALLEQHYSCSRPFLPDYLFYTASGKKLGASGKDGIVSGSHSSPRSVKKVFLDDAILRGMAAELFAWLNIPQGNAIVEFSSGLSSPGLFIKQGSTEIIRIDSKYMLEPYAVGAILAHEMMHLFLGRKGISHAATQENELLTDLATIQAGLGLLILNGMKHNSNWMITIAALFAGGLYYKEERQHFGYFKGEAYGNYFLKWLKSKNLTLEVIKGSLHPRAVHYVPGSMWVEAVNEDVFISELRKDKNTETIVKFLIAGGVLFLALLRFYY